MTTLSTGGSSMSVSTRSPLRRPFAVVLLVLAVITALGAAPAAADTPQHRPAYHFSPSTNWMNDPNGLIFHKGVSHLVFQHNPLGNVWGNMSWGHATSTDLVHWKEQPVAIPFDANEGVFSCAGVIVKMNRSSFGSLAKPPLVGVDPS